MTTLSRKQLIIIESLNATTHGIGAVLSIVALILLIFKGLTLKSPTSIVAYSIYGASLFVLFLNSTLYHSFSLSRYKALFQKLDHSAIYLLIAGTYTPYLMLRIQGWLGYGLLIGIWLLALSGIVFELVAIGKFPRLSTYLYLGLGWLSVFILYPLIQAVEWRGVLLLLLGGITYSIGTLFYRMKHNKWMHIIWHLFVLGGASFMFWSIIGYV